MLDVLFFCPDPPWKLAVLCCPGGFSSKHVDGARSTVMPWQEMDQSERPTNFIPKSFDSLRQVQTVGHLTQAGPWCACSLCSLDGDWCSLDVKCFRGGTRAAGRYHQLVVSQRKQLRRCQLVPRLPPPRLLPLAQLRKGGTASPEDVRISRHHLGESLALIRRCPSLINVHAIAYPIFRPLPWSIQNTSRRRNYGRSYM